MTTHGPAPHSPLEPIGDFGQHHTLVQLLLGIDALGGRVIELSEAAKTTSPQHAPDDFAFALVGLAALRAGIRGMA